MSWKTITWHIVRLALAALLLWVDLRLFLFYAFVTLLRIEHQLNRVRAITRVFSISHDAKLIAIYGQLGLTPEDIKEAYQHSTKDMEEHQRRQLDMDWKLASGGW
jgi:hypothetical protein